MDSSVLGFALFALLFLVGLASAVVQVYGIVICFKKKWYIGLASLVVPAFALVVGIAKLFKKDILG